MPAEHLFVLVIVLGAFSIPIWWFLFDHLNKRSRNRMIGKALEAGTPPEELRRFLAESGHGEAGGRRERRVPYRAALILTAIGIAFLLAESNHRDTEFPGYVLLMIGAALFLSDLLNRGRRREEEGGD